MTRKKTKPSTKRKLMDSSQNTDSSFDLTSKQPYKKSNKKQNKQQKASNSVDYSEQGNISAQMTPDNFIQNQKQQSSTPYPYPYPPPFSGPQPVHFSQYTPPVADSSILSHIMYSISSIDSRLSKLESMDKKLDKFDGLCEAVDSLFTRVKTSESDVKKLTSQVSELNNTCDSFNIKLDELNAEKDNLWIAQASGGSGSPGKGSKLKKEIAEIHKQNSELKSTVSDLQYEATKNNLIFYGIVDMPGEDVQNLLSGFVRYEMDVKTNINFRSVRRMNSKFKPRPIIATFDNFKQREVVKSSAYKLKSSPFGLSVQYTPDVLAKRKQLLPIQREARAQQAKAVMIRDKLYINNELFDQIKHKQFLPKMETQIPNEKIEVDICTDKTTHQTDEKQATTKED
ncbi:unnamed protein product [Mytilus edulis]|uniref:Uncharacterized protein n=1 Tax=Mytilus edulis TaxID=6550 RepID=A0A8S3U5U4_MYTED|nr:unnamed protein product [Mytilus edulis]